jgi:hypothetical protein
MHNDIHWLEDLIEFDIEIHKSFKVYYQVLYSVFRHDFIQNKVKFNKFNVTVDKTLNKQGIEKIFYHITCGSDITKPDFNRCSRIAWNKCIIENSTNDLVKVWKNERGRKINYCLFLEKEQFLIILLDLKSHVKFITAYYIEHEQRKKDIMAEFERYRSNIHYEL